MLCFKVPHVSHHAEKPFHPDMHVLHDSCHAWHVDCGVSRCSSLADKADSNLSACKWMLISVASLSC